MKNVEEIKKRIEAAERELEEAKKELGKAEPIFSIDDIKPGFKFFMKGYPRYLIEMCGRFYISGFLLNNYRIFGDQNSMWNNLSKEEMVNYLNNDRGFHK